MGVGGVCVLRWGVAPWGWAGWWLWLCRCGDGHMLHPLLLALQLCRMERSLTTFVAEGKGVGGGQSLASARLAHPGLGLLWLKEMSSGG